MNDTVKGTLLSKTMWLNGAVAVLGVVDSLQAHAGWLAVFLPNTGPLMAGLGILGIILRAITSQSLSEKGAQG
jgi:hypothetical protein